MSELGAHACGWRPPARNIYMYTHRHTHTHALTHMPPGVDVLSHKKKANFWRELVELFPNIVDYLCNPNVDPVSTREYSESTP
jgi:hypothetical protein